MKISQVWLYICISSLWFRRYPKIPSCFVSEGSEETTCFSSQGAKIWINTLYWFTVHTNKRVQTQSQCSFVHLFELWCIFVFSLCHSVWVWSWELLCLKNKTCEHLLFSSGKEEGVKYNGRRSSLLFLSIVCKVHVKTSARISMLIGLSALRLSREWCHLVWMIVNLLFQVYFWRRPLVSEYKVSGTELCPRRPGFNLRPNV